MMRIVTFIVFAFMLVAQSAQAQLDKSNKPLLKIGLTAGLNLAQMRVGSADMKQYAEKPRPGFQVGPTLAFYKPSGIGFDLSALYDQRGAQASYDSKVNVKYQTVQVPLNIRYGVNLGNMIAPYIFVGPQFAFNVGHKERYLATGIGRSTGHTMIRKWEAQSTAVSMNFGIGLLAMDKVQARFCYNLQLTKNGWFSQYDTVTGVTAKMYVGRLNSCQVAVTYFFN